MKQDSVCGITHSDGKWYLAPSGGLAPGVLWFDGDLEINNGNLFNTVLATGNIESTGGSNIAAINFAGFDNVCKGKVNFTHNGGSVTADGNYKTLMDEVVNGDPKGQYPKDVCGVNADAYTPSDLGNMALMAGGIKPGTTDYVGGDISLKTNSSTFGTLLAGDLIYTSGDNNIYGYMMATGWGDGLINNNAGSQLSNTTTADSTELPYDYDSTNRGDGRATTTTTTTTTGKTVTVLWSRYR